jgi:hypothetical protein
VVVDLLIDVLAVHRMTRLVTSDVISRPARAEAIRFAYDPFNVRTPALTPMQWEAEVMLDDEPPWLAKLVTCRWCSSVWCAAFAVLARTFAPRAWRPAARALALSSASSLLVGLERGYDPA